MQLSVDQAQRFAKMRAHTAAHLLHAELVKIFPATKQAGSFVDEDYLRFDFAADRALTPEEMAKIQSSINTIIYAALPVTTTETSFDEAVKLGAKAFFEDKYGDVVRLVKVDQDISTELCGGTHVTNTKDI
jgi:alanyl-tRNA synthetase